MLANTSEPIIERIALANFFLIKSREDNRTCLLSNCRRIISAIISNNKNIDKLLRVILYTDAVDKVANYRIFVARRNQNSLAVVFLSGKLRRLFSQGNKHVDDLISVATGEHYENTHVEKIHKRKGR